MGMSDLSHNLCNSEVVFLWQFVGGHISSFGQLVLIYGKLCFIVFMVPKSLYTHIDVNNANVFCAK